MPNITVIICDCGCNQRLEIADRDVPGAEKMLQITDAMGKRFWFMDVECLRKWLTTYKCPYMPTKVVEDSADSFLPGGIN